MKIWKLYNFNQVNRDNWVSEQVKKVPKGSVVLDAGAGRCRYRYLFNHCEYKAQDFCKHEGNDLKCGGMDYICDICHIPAPDGYFDVILCTEVLEHIPRPYLAIKEFSRLLKSGGQLFISAPLGSGIHMPPHHFYGGFSSYWYEYFLPEYGFKIIGIEANGGFFKHYGQESQRFLSMTFETNNEILKFLFYPLKVMFALYFRILIPLICHLLDKKDKDKYFTVGYFVNAIKVED